MSGYVCKKVEELGLVPAQMCAALNKVQHILYMSYGNAYPEGPCGYFNREELLVQLDTLMKNYDLAPIKEVKEDKEDKEEDKEGTSTLRFITVEARDDGQSNSHTRQIAKAAVALVSDNGTYHEIRVQLISGTTLCLSKSFDGQRSCEELLARLQ